jgi:hypothetical protein
MNLTRCDKCKIEKPTHEPEHWVWIEVQCNGVYHSVRKFDLCPSCREALGISAPPEGPEKDLKERFFEIWGDLISDAVDERL